MKEIVCKNCLGCNLLEIPYFKGKTECQNYIPANKSGLDLCKRIIEGEQIKL